MSMSSVVPGVTYTRHGNEWRAPGYTTLTGTVDRSTLVRGTYTPNSDLAAGLLPGWTPQMLTPVNPGSNGTHSITTPGPYVNKLFWGQVKMQSAIEPVFINCAFAGNDPANPLPSTIQGAIKCFGSGYYQWRAEDSLIDAALWMDPTLVRPGNAPPTDLNTWRTMTRVNVGIHGGRMTLRRVQIKNVIDGVNSVQVQGSPDTYFTLMEDCWIHKMHYYKGPAQPSLPEGSHSDCFQFSIGPHYRFVNCYFGGYRDQATYDLYTGEDPEAPISYNGGDDAWNSCLMIEQETSTEQTRLLRDIEFDGCFFEGGNYSINHHYVTSRPNLMPDTLIHDCFFVRRPTNRYVIRSSNYAHCYSNNRIIDLIPGGGFTVGEPIPYVNG